MYEVIHKSKISFIEDLIKSGKILSARKEIAKINFKKLSRIDKVQLANLSRRAGDVLRSLRILKPTIDNKDITPTNHEITAYAAGLISIGADQEGISLIRPLVKNLQSDALLHYSLFLIKQWNYKSASFYLKKYILTQKSSIYNKLIGRINLISCYIVLNELDKAEALICKCKKVASKKSFNFALIQLYRLQTQVYLQRKEFSLAYAEIRQIVVSDKIETISDLISAKWLAVIQLYEKPNDTNSKKEIYRIKEKAIELRSWETVRDCDFHLATTTKDLDLLVKLYQGASSVFFKKKILHELDLELRAHLQIRLSEPSSATEILLNCKENSLVYQLVQILSTDLYRSFPIGEIFSKIHQEEKFNALSSVDRIKRLIQRAKHCIRSSNISIDIKIIGNQCKLISPNQQFIVFKPKSLNIESERVFTEKDILADLRKTFKAKTCTNAKIRSHLNISKSQTRLLLIKYLKTGIIKKVGSKFDGTYIFNNNRNDYSNRKP